MIKMLANSKLIIMLPYINVSNQHIAHFKFTQCCTSIISQLKNTVVGWDFSLSNREKFNDNIQCCGRHGEISTL